MSDNHTSWLDIVNKEYLFKIHWETKGRELPAPGVQSIDSVCVPFCKFFGDKMRYMEIKISDSGACLQY